MMHTPVVVELGRRRSERRNGVVLCLVAAAAMWARVAAPAAPPAKAVAGELRPAYATSADVAQGKRLADGLCARCHGSDGVSTRTGVPHLASQRPSYLYSKVKAYQSGARSEHAMEAAVNFLNEDALVKLAAYYASLEPAAPVSAVKPTTAPDAVALGKAASAACAACHGEAGVSKTPGMPNLTGLTPKYFVAAMHAYRSGHRKHDAMKSIVAAIDDANLSNLALYYALQNARPAQTPAGGDAAAGKTASATCASCHGEQGVSNDPAIPSLAGQDAQYFAEAMRAYRNGTRTDDAMKAAASTLSDRATSDLAAFYAAQSPRQPKVDKPLTLAEWAQRCDRCHGINGNSTDPRTPALAAQRAEYLQKALQAYQAGHRRSSVMSAMTGTLRDTDVAALAAHYAQQKPRPFVFVVVPER